MRSRDLEFERKDRPAPVEDRDTICSASLRSEGLAMTDDTCLCTGLRQAAHAMTEIYDEALAIFDQPFHVVPLNDGARFRVWAELLAQSGASQAAAATRMARADS